jgi:uridine phosphorylase
LSRVARWSAAVPKRLRPTAPIAAAAVLVGDPGRALLLAQELLEEPKMSNHARGLWGYSGQTPAGHRLTIQATGMGGPSAAVVLDDLAELGVKRAIRVGTCVAVDPSCEAGELLVAGEARRAGETVLPDPGLSARLERELAGGARTMTIASFDGAPEKPEALPVEVTATDMQTATVLAHGRALGIAAAAVLIVEETAGGGRIADGAMEDAARRAGAAAATVLSG